MAPRQWAVGVFLAIGVITAMQAGASATADRTRVRIPDPAVRRLFEEGTARSRTFTELVARVERTTWLVFVERGRCRVDAVVACLLHAVGRYGNERYLRIVVNVWRLGSRDRQISTIAHELQHALEVTEAPGVADTEDVIRLFNRTGYVMRSGATTTYETDAALHVGHQVLGELRRSR